MYNFSCEGIEIGAVQVCLPQNTNNSFKAPFHAPESQTAADLAFSAASKLLSDKQIDKSQIGAVLFFSRTPDYRSPATSIILQSRLGISKNTIAYDSNYGGCGFIAAITTGSSILKTLNESYVLLLVADTSSKQDPQSVNNDAASAILLQKSAASSLVFSGFTHSNSAGAETLEKGGFKNYQTNLIKNDGQISYRQDLIVIFEEKLLQILKERTLISAENKQKCLLALHPKSTLGSKFKETDWEVINNISLGSTIPLHFTTNNSDEPVHAIAGAVGEGMSAQFIEFSCKAHTFGPVIYSDQIFEDSLISHEI